MLPVGGRKQDNRRERTVGSTPSLRSRWLTLADPIELRVYRGADGEFTLYEDEGENYDYEKGVCATIPFRWDDARQVLTIGARLGQFPGMLDTRTFRIVFVGGKHGTGGATTDTPDRIVPYSGKQVTVAP